MSPLRTAAPWRFRTRAGRPELPFEAGTFDLERQLRGASALEPDARWAEVTGIGHAIGQEVDPREVLGTRAPADEFTEPIPRTTTDNEHARSEEHTSELQSQSNLVCRLLLEKKKNTKS